MRKIQFSSGNLPRTKIVFEQDMNLSDPCLKPSKLPDETDHRRTQAKLVSISNLSEYLVKNAEQNEQTDLSCTFRTKTTFYLCRSSKLNYGRGITHYCIDVHILLSNFNCNTRVESPADNMVTGSTLYSRKCVFSNGTFNFHFRFQQILSRHLFRSQQNIFLREYHWLHQPCSVVKKIKVDEAMAILSRIYLAQKEFVESEGN